MYNSKFDGNIIEYIAYSLLMYISTFRLLFKMYNLGFTFFNNTWYLWIYCSY